MSYARFGFDSDVYLIGTHRGGLRVIECCACSLDDTRPSPTFTTAVGACQHMDLHKRGGEKVPEEAYDSVLADDDWLRGDDVPAGDLDGHLRSADGSAEEGTGA